MGLAAYFRLARAGFVLAREGALSIFDNDALPPVMQAGVRFGRLFERGEVKRTGKVERLTRALNRLGPTYVKLGQTLATRPDIVGAEVAAELAVLQDAMEPFDDKLVPGLLEAALGSRAAELTNISPPIAAASIAQVHHATLTEGNGGHKVAVKILRPGIRQRFRADIESQYAGARLAETLVPKLRRLRPVDVVTTLDRSARVELDLRLEAAAISEFYENIKDDAGFVIPKVLWDYTSDSVLTTTWVDGIPIRDNAALDAAGVDRKALAKNLLQAFLRHTVRDGFFHADLHPGNLFADPTTHDVIAVDFGIMGRITRRERRTQSPTIGSEMVQISSSGSSARATPSTSTMDFWRRISSGRVCISNSSVVANSCPKTFAIEISETRRPCCGSPMARSASAKSSMDWVRGT